MPDKQRLFTITYWLLNAASVFFIYMAAGGPVTSAAWVLRAIGFPANILHPEALGSLALVMALTFICFLLVFFAFRAMVGIVRSAMSGDPFIGANADRLMRIGGLLLTVKILDNVVPTAIEWLFPLAAPAGTQVHGHFNLDIPSADVIGILLFFVLAQIFRRGDEMRADLEGTV